MVEKVNISQAIINAAERSGRPPQEIAEDLFDFGYNITTAKGSETAIFEGKTAEDIKNELLKDKRLYNGKDSEKLDKWLETFYLVFDENGDGTFSADELSILSQNSDGRITPYDIHHSLHTTEVSDIKNIPAEEEDTSKAAKTKMEPTLVTNLPEGCSIGTDNKIYAADGNTVIGYCINNGNNDSCYLYANPENLPSNTYMTEDGKIYYIPNKDTKIMMKELDAESIPFEYTVDNNVIYKNGRDDVGYTIQNGDGNKKYFLNSDIITRETQNIPASWTIDQATGEIKDNEGNTLTSVSYDDLDENLKKKVTEVRRNMKAGGNAKQIETSDGRTIYITKNSNGDAYYFIVEQTQQPEVTAAPTPEMPIDPEPTPTPTLAPNETPTPEPTLELSTPTPYPTAGVLPTPTPDGAEKLPNGWTKNPDGEYTYEGGRTLEEDNNLPDGLIEKYKNKGPGVYGIKLNENLYYIIIPNDNSDPIIYRIEE